MSAAGVVLIVISVVLIIANLAGRMRWPRYADRAAAATRDDPIFDRVAPFTSIENLQRNSGESAEQYALRLTHDVNRCFVHHIYETSPNVPFTQNWILWLLGWLPIGFFRRYEFIRAERALKRGFGFCSQCALILVDLAQHNALRAHVLRFPGHVVAEIGTSEGTALICDADYGVSLPGPADSLATRRNEIHAAYAGRTSAERAANVVRILTSGFETFGTRDIASRRLFEDAAFALKWLVPVAGIFLGLAARAPA